MIYLDTGFLIRALVRGSPEDSTLRSWLKDGERVFMCAIAWTEFLCGPLGPKEVELATRIVHQRTSITELHAQRAAALFNASGRRRGSLADCLIAASAIEESAPLATTNRSDFQRFEGYGLKLAAVPTASDPA